MPHAPRPAPRVLLAARYAAPRAALLARPAGPVAGVDLARGAPVVLELVPDAPGLEGHALHRGRRLLVAEPPAAWRAAPPPPAPSPRALRRARVVPVRVVRLGLAGLLAGALALLVPALVGGTASGPPRARAAAPHRTPARTLEPEPAGEPAGEPVGQSARIAPARRHAVHVPPPAVHAPARGGAARVLVAAARVQRAARPRRGSVAVTPSRPAYRAPPPSTGWVAGLFEGS